MKKNLARLSFILLCVLCLSFSAEAQKKRKTTRKTSSKTSAAKTAAATAAAAAANAATIKEGAGKVSIQVKNLTKFLYTLGGVAKSIEDIDKDVKAGRASQSTADLNNKYKQVVLQSLRNLRAGLDALETEFRAKPALRTYLLSIEGISDTTGVAEQQANSGQFSESGKTLLLVVEKLSDTLAAMP
jgi:hypothetical protein